MSMAANGVDSGLPWRQQPHGDTPFLVALFLVKSKLAHISIQDYISRLRSFIKWRQRPANDENVHRHVDTINFWRDAYTKSEAAQSALRDRIIELEQPNDSFSARCRASTGPVPKGSSHGKRKRDIADASEALATIAAKRSRSAANSTPRGYASTGLASAGSDIGSSSSDSHAAAFLSHVADVHKMSTTKNPDADCLARALICCASDIAAFLRSSPFVQATDSLSETRSTVTRKSMKTPTAPADNRQRESKLLVVGSAFATLIRGLDILEGDNKGLRLQGSIIYSIVDVFREILVHINSLAATSARRQHEQREPTTARSRRGHQKQFMVAANRGRQRPMDQHSFELSHLAITILESLDQSKPAQIGIMEGCMYFLLQRVGKILEVFVFGEEQSDMLPADTSCHPVGESSRNGSTSNIDLLVAESESSYLIHILQQAVTCRIPRSRLPISRQPGTCTRHGSLLGKSELQLQHTLLQGTFGEYAQDFLNALKEPSAQTDDPQGNEAIHRQESIREWYKQQVWRLVGWESLREHTGRTEN